MILKKLSASDVGIGGQLAVNISKTQVDFFNIKNLKNKSNPPNEDYDLFFIEKYSLVKHPITLSYKPSSKQWRIIGLSNTKEYFQKNQTLEGDYLLINNNGDVLTFEVQKATQNNSEFTDFLLIYFYLIEQKSFRDLDKKVYAITNQNGSKSNKRLQSEYDITDLEKKSFKRNGFTKEYENSKDNYRNALDLIKKYFTQVGQNHLKQNSLPIFDIKKFIADCINSNLKYSNQLITRYVSSIATKPFVLLSGLSGSGKTKLAQSFAQWICVDEKQYCIVPVGADWTNREPLLGYVNALNPKEYILPENGALQLIIKANKEENKNKPYFLILDEMNLSHVERYFADFLSVMESKDEFKLHSSESNLNLTDGNKFQKSIEVSSKLNWPKNLFIVGTVNIDETTYMFSPKVLDRANVIEFRINETEMNSYLNVTKDITDLNGEGKSMGESFVTIATEKAKANSESLKITLNDFFITLQEVGAEFGYRTASEIQTLFGQIDVVNPDFKSSEDFKKYSSEDDYKIDIAIMQKLLPKLHGSRNKLTPVLKTLASLCYQKNKDFTLKQKKNVFETIKEDTRTVKYPISLEKITRMYNNAISNGFTSYAEA